MNEIETHVLEMIGEDIDSPDVFTDDSVGMAQIRESINDAIEEITMLTGSVQRKYLMPIRATANFYRLEFTQGHIAWITGVWLQTVQRRLIQTDFTGLIKDNPRWLYNSGSPTVYFPVGETIIGIHPAPADSSDQLQISAVVIPDRYTEDTDRVQLRESMKWGTVNFAVSEYYASRGDAAQAKKHFSDYLDILNIDQLYPPAAERVWGMRSEKTPGAKAEYVR
jgi:hypothetical protein